VAQGLNNLAVLMYHQNNFGDAKLHMEQAVSIWEKVLGPDHPQTKAGKQTLGVIVEESCVVYLFVKKE